MENNQENIPPVIPPEPPKQLDKKLIVVIGLILVVVGIGYVAFNKSHFQKQVVPQTNTQDSTKDWQTYQNEQYNFEIKLPTGWFEASSTVNGPWSFQSADFKDNLHGVGIPNVGNMWVEISQSICHNPRNDDFTGFIAQSKPNILEASLCQDNFYITLGLWQADPDLQKHKEMLNQILSTFKFTPIQSSTAIDTTNWKTYTNTKYGYEFKYPSGARVEENNVNAVKNVVVKDSQNNYLFSLQIFPLEKDETAEIWLKKYSDQIKIPYSTRAVKINGYDAFLALSNSNVADGFYFIKNNDYMFSFNTTATDVEEILSTFKFTNLQSSSFEWCIASGGENRTPNYNAPKVCVLNNKVYKENCVSNTKYFVIESNLTDSVGANHLVKFKTNENQNFDCKYVVENGDFEIKNEWAEYTLALENNFLILDSGTGPDPRGLIIYDLSVRKKVYTDEYFEQSVIIKNNAIDYWSPTNQKATPENCPKFSEYEKNGVGAEGIDSHVVLDLSDLSKKELGEYRCSPRQ